VGRTLSVIAVVLVLAAHCHGDAAARILIQAGVDSIEHGSFLTEDTLKLMEAWRPTTGF
jgi:imidazolonepropionase-like amidohydrolase